MASKVSVKSGKLGKSKPEKKPKHGALKKKAHAIMRDIVILRDGGCVCPPPKNGHSSILQAGHLIPGTKGGTYFDLYNVNVQCVGCNGRHEHYDFYYTNWFLEKWDRVEYDRLVSDCENHGLKSYELEEIIVQLEKILDMMKRFPDYKPYFTQNEILSGRWEFKYEEMKRKSSGVFE